MTKRIVSNASKEQRIGTMAYFLFRPLVACVFSILLLFALLSGMTVVTGAVDYILNERFVYLSAVLSGCMGFSVGKYLDQLEKTSEEIVLNKKELS